MSPIRFSRERRTLLIGAAALAGAGIGLWQARAADRAPLLDAPRGWLLISKPGQSGNERLLVAYNELSAQEQLLDAGSDILYLAAELSPNGRHFAVLKRVPRGSMPTDALTLYDRRTLTKLSEVEVEIPFQRSPTDSLSWSADGTSIAVPYNSGRRTLLFSVRNERRLALRAMARSARFQYHPTKPDLALYEPASSPDGEVRLVQIAPQAADRVLETIAGTQAVWSPDGTRLAYLPTTGGSGLVVRELSNGREAALGRMKIEARVWSPNGSRLAVVAVVEHDPLKLDGLIPRDLLPASLLGGPEPGLLIYDAGMGHERWIGGLDQGFLLAHLQWLNDDWLLLTAARARQSFLIDRRGEQRLPVAGIDDFAPLVTWLPDV